MASPFYIKGNIPSDRRHALEYHWMSPPNKEEDIFVCKDLSYDIIIWESVPQVASLPYSYTCMQTPYRLQKELHLTCKGILFWNLLLMLALHTLLLAPNTIFKCF